ncbi:hypothetical protein P170DRAFT_179513 [Aspergillus steynii IBT 23096]|uniref:Uncharacterized protein n=1 Tax=Aspergillus steynii IBT 23096 TaxID=1392250 RepID=A0A2I2G8T9_9EURO|nr:uncharacterized protein P170DRAFT_179513 [Aspergillus steynii IBT 23096]PLB49289.1 hypothetical protein P170DRAFT_179513 [Aspergillus steynii IBT 23096]
METFFCGAPRFKHLSFCCGGKRAIHLLRNFVTSSSSYWMIVILVAFLLEFPPLNSLSPRFCDSALLFQLPYGVT